MEYQIDATKKIFGRLASEVAILLRGKNQPSYQSYLLPKVKVTVKEITQVVFTGKKLAQKKFFHYSGYPGGLKERRLEIEFQKNPAKIFKKAVYGMLPKNKLRDKIIKNLIVK